MYVGERADLSTFRQLRPAVRLLSSDTFHTIDGDDRSGAEGQTHERRISTNRPTAAGRPAAAEPGRLAWVRHVLDHRRRVDCPGGGPVDRPGRGWGGAR